MGRIEAFALQTAEFFERAMESALSGGAGAVDGGLEAVEFFVGQVLRRGDFETCAAAESPCGMDDLAGESLFERRRWREFGDVAGLELVEYVLFFRADEIRDGEETKFGRILQNASLAGGRDRAG